MDCRHFLLSLGLFLSACFWGLDAHAQAPGEIALAREQFTVGVEAARAANWPQALAAFERSYALYAHPETLFNIAGARQKLGQLVAASEAYRSYLRNPATASDTTRRAQAEARLAEITPEIARVGIRVEGLVEGDVLRLDDRELSRAALDADLPIDPGQHRLRLLAGSEVVGETEFAIHARERIEVLLRRDVDAKPVVVAAPTPRATAAAAMDDSASAEPMPAQRSDEQGSVLRKWWLWTAVGAVVAGGVVAAVLLTQEPDQPSEVKGNVGPGVVEIR